MKQGIDVSKWQGVMNWPITAKRVDFAYIKASQGISTDTYFTANYNGANDNGVPVGFYHFYDTRVNWQLQYGHFADLIDRHPCKLLPAVDLEFLANAPAPQMANILLFIAALAEHINALPVIYSGPSYILTYLSRFPELGRYPLWIAHYAKNPKWPLPAPQVPLPWYPFGWTIWQYSADGNGMGPYYGTQSKAIDLDIAWDLPVYQ